MENKKVIKKRQEIAQIIKYLPEDYYFINNQSFPFEKAILITAKTIARWGDLYEAKILEPKKGIKFECRSGELPENSNEKEKFIEDALNWIWENSTGVSTFSLFIKKKINNKEKIIFNHHDDSCCWSIDLTTEQFDQLQESWKADNLPKDLFFQEGQTIVVNIKSESQLSKIRRFLIGGSYVFTPKIWNEMLKTGEAKKFQIENQKTLPNHE